MRIDFNSMFNDYFGQQNQSTRDYLLEVWIGDAKVSSQGFSANEWGAENQFRQVIANLIQDNAPRKAVLSYDYYLRSGKKNVDYIQFTNKAWDNAHSENN